MELTTHNVDPIVYNRDEELKLIKEQFRDNPEFRKMIDLAGIDSTDGTTSTDYQIRCAALEGFIEYLQKRLVGEEKTVNFYADNGYLIAKKQVKARETV